jgi:hypothetical protein
MGQPNALQRRLRQTRYETAARSFVNVLEGIGVAASEESIVRLDDVEVIWPAYLARLRENAGGAVRWPADEAQTVQRRLDELADALHDVSAVWLALVDSEPVGIETPASALLRGALTYLVSAAGDLMLTTREPRDGICVELNHLPSADEYEVVAWGAFAL